MSMPGTTSPQTAEENWSYFMGRKAQDPVSHWSVCLADTV